MATNTRTSYDHSSTREDLDDIIYNIAPTGFRSASVVLV